MKTKAFLSVVLMFGLVLVVNISQSLAQIQPIYVALGGGAHGTLNRPISGAYSHIGIIAAHRTGNLLGSCTEWANRGFLAFCLNFPWVNNEAEVMWEDTARHVGAAVTFMRNQPGITKVVLVTPSGGGPTMSYYQAVAENGPSYCQGSNKLVQCTSSNFPNPLSRADGIIFNDAHPGNPIVSMLRVLNPAVTNDPEILNRNQRARIDPSLDPFDPARGFNPNGPSTYTENFKKRYFNAQADRMNILIHEAFQELREIEQSDDPEDDAPFIVVRATVDHSYRWTLAFIIRQQVLGKLLKNDGSIVTQIVESVRVAIPDLAEQNPTFNAGTAFLTVRSFLSSGTRFEPRILWMRNRSIGAPATIRHHALSNIFQSRYSLLPLEDTIS